MGNAAGAGVLAKYEIGEEVRGWGGFMPGKWRVHHGKAKATGDEVLVFRMESADAGERELERGKMGISRLRACKHPDILKFLDADESPEGIALVTEGGRPLASWLLERESVDAGVCAWGLRCVASALAFLGSEHGAVTPGSVFVTASGDWRLGMFDLSSEEGYGCTPSVSGGRLSALWSSPERNNGEGGGAARSFPGAQDAWSLGCLMVAVFERDVMTEVDVGVVPAPVQSLARGLVQMDPGRRILPKRALEMMQPWLDSFAVVKVLKFLDELILKEAEEKKAFFEHLPSVLPSLPRSMRELKVLPALMNAIEFGAAGGGGTHALAPILDIGAGLERADYVAKVMPCVVRLFRSRDRATRMQLLHHLSSYLDSIPDQDIAGQVWPRIREGFSDDAAPLRVATLKSVLPLLPRLDLEARSLALRHVASMLARDTVPGIRVNSAVCLGRAAAKIPSSERSQLLDPLLRALQDPFPPVRIAALKATGRLVAFPLHLQPTAPPPESTIPTPTPEPDPEAALTPSHLGCHIIPACGKAAVDSDPDVRSVALDLLRVTHSTLVSWSQIQAVSDREEAAKRKQEQEAKEALEREKRLAHEEKRRQATPAIPKPPTPPPPTSIPTPSIQPPTTKRATISLSSSKPEPTPRELAKQRMEERKRQRAQQKREQQQKATQAQPPPSSSSGGWDFDDDWD